MVKLDEAEQGQKQVSVAGAVFCLFPNAESNADEVMPADMLA